MLCKFGILALAIFSSDTLAFRVKQRTSQSKAILDSPHQGLEYWKDQLRIGRAFSAMITATSFMGGDYEIGKEKKFFFSVTTPDGDSLNLKALGLENKTDELTPKAILEWRPILKSVHQVDEEAVSKIWVSGKGGDNTIYVTFKWVSNWDKVTSELVKPPIEVKYGGHRLGVNPWFWGLAKKLWTENVRKSLEEALQANPGFRVFFSGESQGGAYAQACAFMFAVDQANRRKSGASPVVTSAEFGAISFGSYRWLTQQGAIAVKKVLGPSLLGIVSSHGIMMDPYPGFPGRPYHEIPGLWKFEFGDETKLSLDGVSKPFFPADVKLLPCERTEPRSVDNDMSDPGLNCPPSHPPTPAKTWEWKGTQEQYDEMMAGGKWPDKEPFWEGWKNWFLAAKNMHIGRGQHHLFLMTVASQ